MRSRLTLLGRSDAVQSLLAVGWQDELVNDCLHRQKTDFVFPTADVCAAAAGFLRDVLTFDFLFIFKAQR